MAKLVKISAEQLNNNTNSPALSCEYCPNLVFKKTADFVKHLRDSHCSKEGGSFVCHYGYNSVCSSLPLEGVSDSDYIAHAGKHAVMQQSALKNGVSPSGNYAQTTGMSKPTWTVYSAAANLPAVLNDPKKGKQGNFLTKTWGDGFTEHVNIPKSQYLPPDVTINYFDGYLKKIGRRYRRHSTRSQTSINSSSSTSCQEREEFDFSSIPSIFRNPNLDLSSRDTFENVFPFTKDGLLAKTEVSTNDVMLQVRCYQEKFSHYLDIVEVRIAEQVASKSQAFFQAMTSHDVLMEQLTQTINICKALRRNIKDINKNFVVDSLNLLSQPMIQLLLSTPDYVAALDLISTTQEILHQELNGIQSFRHLSSQLTEMEKLVDKMLFTEFQRYSTADLNRPLTADYSVLDADKLVSIISGLLRQKHFQFIDTYKEESITTIRAVTKQRIIEALAASDCCSDQQAAALEVTGLSLTERLTLLSSTIQSLTSLLMRIRAVYEVMSETASLSSDNVDRNNIDKLLTTEEYLRVKNKLNDMLSTICDYCHERLASQLLSPSVSANNDREKNINESNKEATVVNSNNKFNSDKEAISILKDDNSWLSDRGATVTQVCQLASIIDEFTDTCELICGKQCTALRSAFKVNTEMWKQADIPQDFQILIDRVHQFKKFPKELLSVKINSNNINDCPSGLSDVKNFLTIDNEQFAVVSSVIKLVQMIDDIATELQVLSGSIGRYLAELLRHYNSRCCQLVLGAGAMQAAGLKTITSTILVLASRSLKLLLWCMPFVKSHFQELANSTRGPGLGGTVGGTGGVALLDSVERDVRAHIREIEGKILTIVDNLVGGQISIWDARPPVPSQSFRNISRHLVKLHEAVSGILPAADVQSLYRTVNSSFKEKLREQLFKMNIVNNGGPQHGVVISELTFYLEALRNLKVLPYDELSDDWMADIWTR
ncbi:Similar to scat: Vacuolar protein sorting-associated protein 54 (Drosophila melanogaster) [Cotesia congregata]|uniref:Vacuolar protein sorting-associated protein 54 n=1 Tax=Cotesia congregata TaxID=51543 RepID=A0A8J2H8V2_COTCN|nr:Similar to scat: Vacuolar protein sorting-associated protein 54 (Drosophila melanogaster) [Cotesia congregata]